MLPWHELGRWVAASTALLLGSAACIDLPPPIIFEEGGDGPTTTGGGGSLGGAGGAGGGGSSGGAGGAAPMPICAPAAPSSNCATIVQLAPGEDHTCVLASDGFVRCWGSNRLGELGVPSQAKVSALPPRVVPGLAGVERLVSGQHHTCALVAGAVWCWGANGLGQLGTGDTDPRDAPTPANLSDVVDISTRFTATCAVTSSEQVWCWGKLLNGQPWDGAEYTATPTELAGVDDMDSIGWLSVGQSFGCVLSEDGLDLRCWGDNGDGGVGDGTGIDAPAAVPVANTLALPAQRVAAGSGLTCALGGTPTELQCWGDFLPISGDRYFQPTTMSAVDGTTAEDLAVGWAHICVLHADGAVECFGRGICGVLGPLGGSGQPVTEAVPVLAGVTDLAAGWQHNCALRDNGEVRCWGCNEYGQTAPDDLSSHLPVPTLVEFDD